MIPLTLPLPRFISLHPPSLQLYHQQPTLAPELGLGLLVSCVHIFRFIATKYYPFDDSQSRFSLVAASSCLAF